MREALEQGAESWLQLTGSTATYRSSKGGLSKTITATLEKNVETIDDHGMVASGRSVSLSPKDIALPARGDLILFEGGGQYHVDELIENPGHLIRVLVSEL